MIGRRALREVIVAANEEQSFLLTFDAARGRSPQRHLVERPGRGGLAARARRRATRIHIGGSGRQTLVSWRGNSELFYQEHDGLSWLPRQSLALTDAFTLEQAYSLLDGKAR